MPYTLWSHGRLVGQTDLDLSWDFDGVCRGWFRPEPDAQLIVDIAIGVELAKLSAKDALDVETAAADVASAIDRCSALDLQLQGPDGEPIATSDIAISDTVTAIFGQPNGDEIWYEQLSEEERKLFDESVEKQCEMMELRRLEHRESGEYDEDDDDHDDFDDDDMRYEILVRLPRRRRRSPATHD